MKSAKLDPCLHTFVVSTVKHLAVLMFFCTITINSLECQRMIVWKHISHMGMDLRFHGFILTYYGNLGRA